MKVGKLRQSEGGYLHFWCPGCEGPHMIAIGDGAGPRWGYNGNPDSPTFTPSVLVNAGRSNPASHVCHTFVTDGRIQFLGDCTHALAGQTVDLPPFPESWA